MKNVVKRMINKLYAAQQTGRVYYAQGYSWGYTGRPLEIIHALGCAAVTSYETGKLIGIQNEDGDFRLFTKLEREILRRAGFYA